MVGRPKPRRNGRPAMAAPYRIRPAQPADVAAVAAIERAVFSDPWSANDFSECLAAETPFLVAVRGPTVAGRSEEHTSELQSQSNLVCRLLLEKKKFQRELNLLHAGGSAPDLTDTSL